MLSDAQVIEPVPTDGAFERDDGEGIFWKFWHSSGGESNWSGLDEFAGEFPIERVGLETIPVTNEGQHLGAQIRDALERAVAQQTALQDREPDLDLVDPGGVQGRVDEDETTAMMAAELGPAAIVAVVMNVEIVPDYEDPALRKSACDDVQEVVHSASSALIHDASEHAPGPNIEGPEQVAYATTDVLEFVSHRSICDFDDRKLGGPAPASAFHRCKPPPRRAVASSRAGRCAGPSLRSQGRGYGASIGRGVGVALCYSEYAARSCD
jgi:hypothetical protein